MAKYVPMFKQSAFPAAGEDVAQNGLTKLEYAAIHLFAARTASGVPEGESERTIADECVGDALVLFEQLEYGDEDEDRG